MVESLLSCVAVSASVSLGSDLDDLLSAVGDVIVAAFVQARRRDGGVGAQGVLKSNAS